MALPRKRRVRNNDRNLFSFRLMKNALVRISTTFSAAVLASQAFAIRAFAALPDAPSVPGIEEDVEIEEVIVRIIVNVLDFILIVAVAFVIIAGIRLIISGGEEGEKDKAKKTIIYVIAGILVILLARVIVSFVNTLFD